MIPKPRTLLWRLGLGLMAVQAAAALLLGWYAAARFREFNRLETISELQRLVPFLSKRYGELAAGQVSDAAIDDVVKADAALTTIRVTLIAPDGRVIADSEREPLEMDNHLHRPEVASALRGESTPDVRESTTTGEQTTYLAQVVADQGKPSLIVRGSLPLSAVRALPANVARVVGLAALLSLLLTFVIMYLVSRRLSGSVQRLADGAARFAAGDLSHRIDRPASREMAALAEGLNHMAGRLNDQIDLLQAQRNEQQAIHQSMSNGLIALDPQQRIISLNRAAERLLALDGAAVRGRLLQETVREPELHRFVAEALSRPGQQSALELQLRRTGGPRIHVVSQALRDAKDQAAGLLMLITDVTELRRLETVRSDFAANVSHELRTPITSIKGYVETMLEVGLEDQVRSRQFLEVISRNTRRLESIIEDLLALARLEQPGTRATLKTQKVSAMRVVEASVAQLESEIAAKGTRIVTHIPADLVAHANVQLLEQALGNLISNAVRYSPSGSTVTISGAQHPGGEVSLSVADQGPGIPQEHLSRIFERFYRIDRARSRDIGGTGLGLSIVKHIALVHRGSVTVESRVGEGSTFRMVLPGVAH